MSPKNLVSEYLVCGQKNAKLNFPLWGECLFVFSLQYFIISKRQYYHPLFIAVLTECMPRCWYNITMEVR